MTKVLTIGGYGAVGRQAAAALVRHDPEQEVVVAGRNPATAASIPGTTALRIDASDAGDLAAALDGVEVVLMCAELDNARVARACLERGIHYLDVTASHDVLVAIEDLDDLASRNDATAVLSVGLAPGVTNLLARIAVERSETPEVDVGVLLGAGEQHGPAALAWTLNGLGELSGSWTVAFPAPYGDRTVHRFPFSDQYTLPDTLAIASATTGLALDSRLTTALLGASARPRVARFLHRPRVRNLLSSALTRLHIGGDGFAVTARSGAVQTSLSGHLQSRATGLTAAQLIRQLPVLPAGVAHTEQLVDPVAFLTELAVDGDFVLDI